MKRLIAQFCIVAMVCFGSPTAFASQAAKLAYQWHSIQSEAPAHDFATSATARGSFADYAGKRVLINFWATWCGPCISELPALDALAVTNPDLVVLAVAAENAPYHALQDFMTRLGVKHLIMVQDDTGTLLETMGKGALPISYLMNEEGTLTHWYLGATDWTDSKHRSVLFPKR